MEPEEDRISSSPSTPEQPPTAPHSPHLPFTAPKTLNCTFCIICMSCAQYCEIHVLKHCLCIAQLNLYITCAAMHKQAMYCSVFIAQVAHYIYTACYILMSPQTGNVLPHKRTSLPERIAAYNKFQYQTRHTATWQGTPN